MAAGLLDEENVDEAGPAGPDVEAATEGVTAVEEETAWDTKTIIEAAGVVLIIAIGLGLWLYSRSVAAIGVNLISSFSAPVTSGFNGLASAITAFFQMLANKLAHLVVVPATAVLSVLVTV